MAALVQTAAATPARQPFAPVDGVRLQNLTSVKNRQNALSPTQKTPLKRNAAAYEADDFDNAENVDPSLFSAKRSKVNYGLARVEYSKPNASQIILTKPRNDVATYDPAAAARSSVARHILQPRSPAARLHSSSVSSSLSAPAGRSPTKRRVGILHRRRSTASAFTRVDPPQFAVGSATVAPFSIDAALGGTISSYRQRARDQEKISTPSREPQMKAGWYFDIYEDTPEETMTNLMEHGTHVLDISSDEETDARRRARDDRGKENIPPTDDVGPTPSHSQSLTPAETRAEDGKSSPRAVQRRNDVEQGAIEVDRKPLGDLVPENYYSQGHTEEDVVYVEDEEDETVQSKVQHKPDVQVKRPVLESPVRKSAYTAGPGNMDGAMEVEDGDYNKGEAPAALDEIIQGSSCATGHAALFEPLEKADDGFEIWESESAKGETDGDA